MNAFVELLLSMLFDFVTAIERDQHLSAEVKSSARFFLDNMETLYAHSEKLGQGEK